MRFQKVFDEEKEVLKHSEEENIEWQLKVCDILDNYTKKIETTPDHIADDILDSNVLNENSVESLY